MSFQGNSIFWVEVDKIVPNPYQPRREFNEESLKELGESIRMYGVLQPLTVSRREVVREDGTFYTEYELIAGERRLRASRLAGVEQVPVIIREGEESEQEKLELAIIENLQREDLNAVDRALAFKQLADTFGLSHAQVAAKVGRSREYVSNSIRILHLPEHMLTSLRQGDISEGHARTLLMLNDRSEEQETVYREILLKKLSVREVERIARKIATDKVRKKDWHGTDPALIEIERQLTETLGTRVQIQKTDFGGKLTIDYFSQEDLETMLARLRVLEAEKHTLTEDAAARQELSEHTPLDLHETPAAAEPAPEAPESSDVKNESSAGPTTQPSAAPMASPETSRAVEDTLTPQPAPETPVPEPAHNAYHAPQPPSPPETDASEHHKTPTGPVEPEGAAPAEAAEESEPPGREEVQQPPSEEKTDESDLYSIKNFTV